MISTHPQEEKLIQLHKRWCELTGRTEKYLFARREWFDFAQHYDEMTLENVIRFVLLLNAKRDKKYQIKLHLAEIIGDLARFDSLRADYELAEREREARKRQYVPSAGERELAAMRHEDVKAPEQPAKKVDVNLLITALKQAVPQ